MAFERPSLPDLIQRTTADLVARLELQSPVLRHAVVRVLARVWSGAVHSLHGHLDWAARQRLAVTAQAEQLDEHGADIGLGRLAAAYAGGSIQLVGTSGAVMPAGSRWQRSDGSAYATLTDAVLSGGAASVTVRALEAGLTHNTDAGVTLTLVNPVAGVQSQAAILSPGLTNGLDAESDLAFRARILTRKRSRPQGGATVDYQLWALEVPGVARVFVLPQWLGPGSVGVVILGPDNAIPDAAKVAEVQAWIDDPSRRPVTARVLVFAPEAVPVNLDITLNPDTTATRAAVLAELQSLFTREADPGRTVRRSKLSEAISLAAGEDYHDLNEPAADIPLAPAQIAVLGGVTWS